MKWQKRYFPYILNWYFLSEKYRFAYHPDPKARKYWYTKDWCLKIFYKVNMECMSFRHFVFVVLKQMSPRTKAHVINVKIPLILHIIIYLITWKCIKMCLSNGYLITPLSMLRATLFYPVYSYPSDKRFIHWIGVIHLSNNRLLQNNNYSL